MNRLREFEKCWLKILFDADAESPKVEVVESDKNWLGENSVAARHRLQLHVGNVLLEIKDF